MISERASLRLRRKAEMKTKRRLSPKTSRLVFRKKTEKVFRKPHGWFRSLLDMEQALAFERDSIQTAIMTTVEQWLNDTETSCLVTDIASAAGLAIYH